MLAAWWTTFLSQLISHGPLKNIWNLEVYKWYKCLQYLSIRVLNLYLTFMWWTWCNTVIYSIYIVYIHVCIWYYYIIHILFAGFGLFLVMSCHVHNIHMIPIRNGILIASSAALRLTPPRRWRQWPRRDLLVWDLPSPTVDGQQFFFSICCLRSCWQDLARSGKCRYWSICWNIGLKILLSDFRQIVVPAVPDEFLQRLRAFASVCSSF